MVVQLLWVGLTKCCCCGHGGWWCWIPLWSYIRGGKLVAVLLVCTIDNGCSQRLWKWKVTLIGNTGAHNIHCLWYRCAMFIGATRDGWCCQTWGGVARSHWMLLMPLLLPGVERQRSYLILFTSTSNICYDIHSNGKWSVHHLCYSVGNSKARKHCLLICFEWYYHYSIVHHRQKFW